MSGSMQPHASRRVYPAMRALAAMLAIGLLSVGVAACAGSGAHEKTALVKLQRPAQQVTPLNVRKTRSYLTFGQPASDVDTNAVAIVVKRYYAAVQANDGAKACAQIARTMARAIPEDVGPLAQHHKSCAVVMSRFFKERSGRPTANVAAIEVTSVRIKGDQAIALLRSPAMHAGELTMRREGKVWKVSDLIGSVLPIPPASQQTASAEPSRGVPGSA